MFAGTGISSCVGNLGVDPLYRKGHDVVVLVIVFLRRLVLGKTLAGCPKTGVSNGPRANKDRRSTDDGELALSTNAVCVIFTMFMTVPDFQIASLRQEEKVFSRVPTDTAHKIGIIQLMWGL